jgi:V8-like Glu-specific endopeptidase
MPTLLTALFLAAALTAHATPISPRQLEQFGPVPSTVGKLFITWTDREGHKDNTIYTVCSGVVLNTPTQNIVATAAHCIFNKSLEVNGRSGLADEVTFVPQFDWDKNGPFGVWHSKSRHMLQAYATTGSQNSVDDQAFVAFHPNSEGRKLAAVVGGSGYHAGYSPSNEDVTVWGYPVPKYEGERAVKCRDSTHPMKDTRPDDPNHMEMPCEMGGGASGGPWFHHMKDGDNVGEVFALTSKAGRDGQRHNIAATPLTQAFVDIVNDYTE